MAAVEEKKTKKTYSDIVSCVDFSPFAIETSGVGREHALNLVTEIGRCIAAVTHDPIGPSVAACTTWQCMVCPA